MFHQCELTAFPAWEVVLYIGQTPVFRTIYLIGVGAGPAGPVWPDHFFSNLTKFIIDICTRAIIDSMLYACAYYSRTTSKVLPMHLYLSL